MITQSPPIFFLQGTPAAYTHVDMVGRVAEAVVERFRPPYNYAAISATMQANGIGWGRQNLLALLVGYGISYPERSRPRWVKEFNRPRPFLLPEIPDRSLTWENRSSWMRSYQIPETGQVPVARRRPLVTSEESSDKSEWENPRYRNAIRRLKTGDSEDRARAAQWLGETRNKFVVPALVDALDDNVGAVAGAVMRALEKIGRAAVHALIRALGDNNPDTRERAADVLGNIGKSQVVEPLIRLLEDRNGRVRLAAVHALRKIGDRRAINPLIRQWGVGNAEFREAVRAALKAFGLKIFHP
jgi:HEAT repeat protein